MNGFFKSHVSAIPSLTKRYEASISEPNVNIGVESATIETIKKLVARKVGVGFVPLMCVSEEVVRG